MRDAIENVLGNETYATNEEKVEAITKALATLVIPKDKFNDLSARLKTTESNLTTLQTEYDDYKQSKMTDDEKREAELKQFELDKKANAVEKSSLAVEKLLLKNGIEIKDDDTELKETLESIVSEDYEKSIKLANSFISLLNKTKDQTAKETTTQLLGDTPKPIGGTNSSSTVSKIDSLKNELKTAIDNKNAVEQARIMREIQIEQAKSSV